MKKVILNKPQETDDVIYLDSRNWNSPGCAPIVVRHRVSGKVHGIVVRYSHSKIAMSSGNVFTCGFYRSFESLFGALKNGFRFYFEDKEIVEEDEAPPNEVYLNDVKMHTPIFAMKDNKLCGMVVKESGRGWIVRLGGACGFNGYHASRMICMKDAARCGTSLCGYTFYVED